MKNQLFKVTSLAALATLMPLLSMAQGVADDLQSLQGVLNNLYKQMMTLCSGMLSVSQGIAGFATLWYIGARVWKHLAAAEPVEIYPLLRPFAIGFCILIFPLVLTLMNGILEPTVTATDAMVTTSNAAITRMLENEQTSSGEQQGATSMNSDPDKWYQYSHPDSTGTSTGSTNMADQFSGWGFKNMIKKAIAELLNVLFKAAALCIDTIRTFKLIVLAILGPLCFGLSIFDGFQHTLKQWIARYVNVYLWLPVANIFGAIIAKIQENMIQLEQSGGSADVHFSDTNTAYLIFMVIGIVGYFTVPSIAGYIMNVGGHALFNRTSALASMAVSYIGGNLMQGFTGSHANPARPSSSAGNASPGQSPGNPEPLKEKLSGKN
ncbi:conjugative transposon protein TraJ [Mucilaginibacter robiniae]|uniref:Conjugative transposon protein TraJ n=1 Tax=Mucilaginibacter robiniae TaxID=2728022 RepID=A0A7L5DZ80_9SPHI|nr:conjugative transposon protein TraJ [Mucilaginibacter robiniae]QJD96101.1 conjugative transposon protein TraJ [Mucilaginibacter robiniae]